MCVIYYIAIYAGNNPDGQSIQLQSAQAATEQSIDAAFSLFCDPKALINDIKLYDSRYDLFFVDMPINNKDIPEDERVDEAEFFSVIKKYNKNSPVALIINSGEPLPEYPGVDISYYLTKPVDQTAVLNILDKIFI